VKNSYDIILYFAWVHPSHIHKYLSLKKELNKRFNCLLIFGNDGSWCCPNYGVSSEQLKPFNRFLDDVLIAGRDLVGQILHEHKPKILVFGSDQHAHDWQRQISSELSATTIQLPHLLSSEIFTNANPDYFAVFGPIHEAFLQNCSPEHVQNYASVVKPSQKISINPWLYGLHEDCLSTELSREDFCEKYQLNPDKEILLHCPDWGSLNAALLSPSKTVTGGALGQEILNIYKDTCELDNVITQLHPNEYKRHKSDRIGNKWSYELIYPSASILDPVDSHWAYKYCACGTSHISTIGLEFGFLNKPFVYVGNSAPPRWYSAWEWDGINHYSWVGHECPRDKMRDFFANKNYRIEDQGLYKKHQEKFSIDPNVNFIEFLAEKILSVDIIKK